jgi:hypothetical protein
MIFTAAGTAMTPTYTLKGERLYHYYVSMDTIRNRDVGGDAGPARLPGAMVEGAVIAEMRRLVATPDVASRVIEACHQENTGLDERAAIEALRDFKVIWERLIPAEQSRIVRLLVQRVTVSSQGLTVDLHNNGIAMLVRELTASTQMKVAE